MATKQRSLILSIVKNMHGHLSADEIYILAKQEMPGIALATVYNNLNALYSAGEIGKVKIADSADLYDKSPVIHDAIETLREDAALLELALMGAEVAIIPFTFSCLLRLIEYLCKNCRK